MRKDCDTCIRDEFGDYCKHCEWSAGKAPSKWKPVEWWTPDTNADRIRAMSDEELADFMARRNVTESCLRLADEGYTPTEEQKQVLYDSLYSVWMEWMQAPTEGE